MIVEHYDKEVLRDSVPVDAQSYASAILNILADFSDDKEKLTETQRAILNILDDMKERTMDAHSEPVEVGSLVEEAIEANHGFIEEFGVAVRLEKGGEQGIVRADPDQLIQVVTNLLSNAVKFSPRGDEVIVAVEADETEVRISVRDHGPGIPESARGRIFERFFQVDASDSRQKGGTGLGLAIVKQIVDRLGGRVDFESAPGGGTIFKVTLPQAAQSGPAQAVADAADPFADIAEPTRVAQS